LMFHLAPLNMEPPSSALKHGASCAPKHSRPAGNARGGIRSTGASHRACAPPAPRPPLPSSLHSWGNRTHYKCTACVKDAAWTLVENHCGETAAPRRAHSRARRARRAVWAARSQQRARGLCAARRLGDRPANPVPFQVPHGARARTAVRSRSLPRVLPWVRAATRPAPPPLPLMSRTVCAPGYGIAMPPPPAPGAPWPRIEAKCDPCPSGTASGPNAPRPAKPSWALPKTPGGRRLQGMGGKFHSICVPCPSGKSNSDNTACL
jgi:hypothetical protein